MKRLADFEDYAAATSRLSELRGELSDLERQRDDLYIRKNAHHNTRENAIDLKARALLSGEPETDMQTLEAKYSAICQRIEVLQRAVNMQTATVETLRARYSSEINEQAEPEYMRLLRKAIDAAVTVSKAVSEATQFRDELEQAGVIFTLTRLDSLNRFGIWMNTNAHIHHVIKEAIAAGIIKPGTYDQPQPPGVYDQLTRPIETTAAGPDGISRVRIHKGGKMEKLQEMYKPTSAPAWN